MRPWQHAQSSAGENGDWRADLEIHEFIDSSKLAYPNVRHRMILHNADLGPKLATRAFPHRSDADKIALGHIAQDFQNVPTLADWLNFCDVSKFPRPQSVHPPIDDLVSLFCEEQGLKDESGPQAVLDLLLLPITLAGENAQCVLFNAMGPFLARRIIGPPRPIAGIQNTAIMFEPGFAAEKMIRQIYGTIPALGDVVAAVKHLPAMAKEPM